MKKRVFQIFADVSRIGIVLAAIAAVVAVLLFHVWNQYRITQLGYQIADVTHEHRRLMEENKKLSIEAAVVGRTDRMTDVARERFGLEPLEPEQIRQISVDAMADSDVKQGEGDLAALTEFDGPRGRDSRTP